MTAIEDSSAVVGGISATGTVSRGGSDDTQHCDDDDCLRRWIPASRLRISFSSRNVRASRRSATSSSRSREPTPSLRPR